MLSPQLRYHPQAYLFVTEALRQAQELVGKDRVEDEESAHISGRELLDGVRVLASKQYGMMAPSVFASWGITTTEDFGHIVFEMVERDELRKTERDQLSDFCDVYTFADVFRDGYAINTDKAFSS
ncbi:MAG TPA: Minf_1886 family protein [Planctomycetaceae bacterium]|jgi:uncharacterized repeat protein (TIGR04138 family)|nr:Minf_1886 family protein [Planctomycetaceae bacterium]